MAARCGSTSNAWNANWRTWARTISAPMRARAPSRPGGMLDRQTLRLILRSRALARRLEAWKQSRAGRPSMLATLAPQDEGEVGCDGVDVDWWPRHEQ